MVSKYLIILGLGAASVVGIYTYGRISGINAGRLQQLEATIKAEKERKDVDQTVNRLSDTDLCVRLGGLLEDCQQLRGLDAKP